MLSEYPLQIQRVRQAAAAVVVVSGVDVDYAAVVEEIHHWL